MELILLAIVLIVAGAIGLEAWLYPEYDATLRPRYRGSRNHKGGSGR
jgi:hypothetical protein